MAPDCYKVEVLHLLNPHLIWVEVRDSAIVSVEEHGVKFEQIGIYGVLPLETTIDQEDEEITVHSCQEWLPASATLMRKFLAGEIEILFTPIHLDRRSSIFDDNIHKFGDLFVKKRSGTTKSLSKLLSTSGFATYDECLFHRHLSEGRISTKLNVVDTQNVLTEIEKYYINKNDSKKTWENTIKSNTSVVRVSYELEQALTKTNLDKHNKNMKAILESKNKDLDFCKGVDEPSLGRATTRKGKDKKQFTPLEKKLELLQSFKTKADSKESEVHKNVNDEHAQAFEETKLFLEENATPYSKKISSKTDAHKVQILKKVMSKTAIKKVTKREKLNRFLIELKGKSKTPEEVKKTVNSADVTLTTSSTSSVSGVNYDNLKKKASGIDEPNNFVKADSMVASTSKQTHNELNNDNCIAHSSSVTVTQEVKKINSNSKPNQEITVAAQNTVVSTLKEEQRNEFNDSKNDEHHRRTSKGKTSKKSLKAEVNTSTLASLEPLGTSKHGGSTRSTSSPQRLAYPPQGGSQYSRRVPDLSKDCELFASTIVTKLKRRGKKHTMTTTKAKAFFGPPGININTLSRVPPVFLYSKDITKRNGQNAENISGRLDSIADGDLTPVPGANVSSSVENKHVSENVKLQVRDIRKHRNERKDTSSSGSSVWERRLKLHKEMAKNKRASLTSDTTNKDSSNIEQNNRHKYSVQRKTEADSDESISEILDKFGIPIYKSSMQDINGDNLNIEYTYSESTVKANPFQNLDLSNSVFVENLVTPIMMVHSKMNKRFTPTCNYRDVHFNDHIRLVLKNLRVYRPMMLQSITWNAILRGHSVFMIGSASSGKTMGYLPAVCGLVSDYNQIESNCGSVGPFCIIVCATSQSVSEIEKVARMLVGCDEKVVSCYYGYDELAIVTTLLNGCDLLISTAPSLVRLLEMSDFGLDLDRLATFVMDDCERLSEVYAKEMKTCLNKIKEMMKRRANKELRVQYVIASRIWCDFMEPFAKKAPDSVVCIGTFQECVLYSKSNMTVSYVKDQKKLQHVIEFLEGVDPSKKTVVVCGTDYEVEYLCRQIQSKKYFIFAANSTMTVQQLYNLSMLWKEFREPLMAPVLVCLDMNLYHMNVTNAHYLVQYSMPSLYSTFCRRFATLNESYPSIFKTDNHQTKILILLDENNVEQLPKIVHFVKRCTNNVPDFLNDICTAVLTLKDTKKAECLAPLCNNLMSLGDCPDFYNCRSRHTILKDYDKPKEWMPKCGLITFKILHYQSAAFYSARLIENYGIGTPTKYPSSYSSISLKMGMHYSSKKNRITFGVPQLGDVCAVALRNNLFSRAQVIKIIDRYDTGNPKTVLVNLLDEEIMEITLDTSLYHLPDSLKSLDTYVVHVRLANIQPRDKDIDFSELARDHVRKEGNDPKKGIYMKGNIILTIGNCIFIDTLEAYEDLKTLNQSVVMYNLRSELLEKHAEINVDHIFKLQKLCKKAGLEVKEIDKTLYAVIPCVKVKSHISWAHLEKEMSIVEFRIDETPNVIFLRLTKFDECFKFLIIDIQKYITHNTAKIEKFIRKDIVLAEYPDDGMYERARIDEVGDDKIKCFFVDQGEWRYLNKDKVIPIPKRFITQLPFQAIECRLLGIEPSSDQWTDLSMNWLFDKTVDVENNALKQFFVKYFTKEPAQFTGGYKYGVVLIDTCGHEDIIINQAMLNLNLVTEATDEIKFLEIAKDEIEIEVRCKNEDDDESWEKTSKYSTTSDRILKPASNVLLSQPIRSVPLVGSDESDDSEKWHINMTDDMAAMFKPVIENSTQDTKPIPPAIENHETKMLQEIDIITLPKNIKECSHQFQSLNINPDSSKELDSDDLSSPESVTEMSQKVPEALPLILELQLRKPKLNWRQTKPSVMIKIQLIGVETYDLNIQDRALSFTAVVNDTNYGFDFSLYGVIDKKSATHSNKGQYILVKFDKIMHKNWLSLTKDGENMKWITYDVDSIDTSSDEEEIQKDDLYNIMKNIHQTDSESDDEHIGDVS